MDIATTVLLSVILLVLIFIVLQQFARAHTLKQIFDLLARIQKTNAQRELREIAVTLNDALGQPFKKIIEKILKRLDENENH